MNGIPGAGAFTWKGRGRSFLGIRLLRVAEDLPAADSRIQTGVRERTAQIGLNACQHQGNLSLSQMRVELLEQVQESGVRISRPVKDQNHCPNFARSQNPSHG